MITKIAGIALVSLAILQSPPTFAGNPPSSTPPLQVIGMPIDRSEKFTYGDASFSFAYDKTTQKIARLVINDETPGSDVRVQAPDIGVERIGYNKGDLYKTDEKGALASD